MAKENSRLDLQCKQPEEMGRPKSYSREKTVGPVSGRHIQEWLKFYNRAILVIRDTKTLLKTRNPYLPPKSVPSVTPISSAKRKVPHWSRVVYAFFSPMKVQTRAHPC